MAKMKTNQDGGSVTAKDSSAAGKQLEKNQAKEGAARMGYNQSFGAARMGGYAKGAAKVANIMSFGAAKYGHMGAANAGHGGSAGHKHDPVDGDKVPAYKVKNTTTTRSGGGSSTSNDNNSNSSGGSSSNGKSYSSAYKNADKSEYPTLESFTVAAKAYNAKKKNNSTSESTNNNSTNSEVKEKTIVIGDKTKNDVVLSGNEAVANARSKRAAKKLAKVIAVKKDSTKFSNNQRKLRTHDGRKPLTPVVGNKITGLANQRARKDITSTVGKAEAEKMFPTAAHYRTGPEAGTEGGVFTWEDYE